MKNPAPECVGAILCNRPEPVPEWNRPVPASNPNAGTNSETDTIREQGKNTGKGDYQIQGDYTESPLQNTEKHMNLLTSQSAFHTLFP